MSTKKRSAERMSAVIILKRVCKLREYLLGEIKFKVQNIKNKPYT